MNYDYEIYKTLLNAYKPEEIAKYIRLSLADEENGKSRPSDESESVINQRRLINSFIDRNGSKSMNCQEFIDDGVSGTNFDRPG